jgi:hypothetical protein
VHTHEDTDADPNADADPDHDGNTNSDADAHEHADPHAHEDAHTDTDANRDTHTDRVILRRDTPWLLPTIRDDRHRQVRRHRARAGARERPMTIHFT